MVYKNLENSYCDELDKPSKVMEISIIDNENNKQKTTFTTWMNDGDEYYPSKNIVKTIPPGYYTIEYKSNYGYYFQKQEIKTNKLYYLPNNIHKIILDDINKFWVNKEAYIKYERVFRRNYLIYSSPGTGKTSLINLICKDLIEKQNGIVLSLRNTDDIIAYSSIMGSFREIEPERPMTIIIEDIDNIIDFNNSIQTLLLNMLDGNLVTNNCVFIATTNYPEKLTERYMNRPSRFDRIIEFPLPDSETRRSFITQSIKPDDLEKIDINKWVERTNGYSIDHINELILLFFVFGHTEEHAFEEVNKMANRKGVLKNTNGKNKTIGL